MRRMTTCSPKTTKRSTTKSEAKRRSSPSPAGRGVGVSGGTSEAVVSARTFDTSGRRSSPSPTGRGVGVRVGTGGASVPAAKAGASASASPVPPLIRLRHLLPKGEGKNKRPSPHPATRPEDEKARRFASLRTKGTTWRVLDGRVTITPASPPPSADRSAATAARHRPARSAHPCRTHPRLRPAPDRCRSC